MTSSVRSLLKKIRDRIGARLIPTGIGDRLNRNDREGALHHAWGYVFTNQIKGGYYEFGVYRGDTFRTSYKVWQEFNRWQMGQLDAPELWRRQVAEHFSGYNHGFYAFDTFEGMPNNQEGEITFGPGTFAFGLDEFRKLNEIDSIVENDHIRYYKGTFADIREQEVESLQSLQQAAIINLDCDLYQSAKVALNIIGSKLMQGTVLLVDDWYTFKSQRNAGERRAISEFLEEHPEIEIENWFSYHYSGQAFIIHRREIAT